MIITILIISTIINVFFVWYVYTLLKKLLFVSDNIGDFLQDLQEYSEHVETVYNMETYYGDETIEHLLEHSRGIVKEITAYKDIYEITHDEITHDETTHDEVEEQEDLDDS